MSSAESITSLLFTTLDFLDELGGLDAFEDLDAGRYAASGQR